ncbi:MAG: iron export ABC transporter permease subunit FetB [Phycisphaera sp.]|nr:iron export ABC transporter permease subunit FetB [Phycisphaera sp.]
MTPGAIHITTQALAAIEPVRAMGPWHTAMLLGLVAVVVIVSAVMHLGVGRDVTIATARSIVQLLAIGLIIGWVFDQRTWYAVLGMLLVMSAVAGFTAAGRTKLRLVGLSWLFTGALSVLTGVTLVYIAVPVLQLDTWDPRYLIPLGGMILGNAMTAASLSTERLVTDLKQRTADVEAMLAMSASPTQATAPLRRAAVRAAMTPTINTMMVVGIVKLPGMMTGQMLGGSDPMQAALYQLLILVAIVFCDTAAAVTMTTVLHRRFFTTAWQVDRTALSRVRSED